ncbi:hypothetical protein SacmaDRAFT_4362 [Saccharomonospora marina XMU15]|uniref:PPE family protein n=1 Tax=Saccharomonospora marina XMU15 TaxID=882083 RepID=H5X8X3_9PSEU|nr:hypothetical protein [Saccharomonospora marina]EHR52548.1 hypothetical protein SacmaDRAFT_4362 [Saccharomonospora marina XMU15]
MPPAMNGEQIYNNFRDAAGTEGLQQLARVVVELQNTYGDRAQSIKDLQSAMESGWTGDAGASARAGAGPLARALTSSADNMDATVNSLKTQADTWHNAANSVEPVPPMPEKPSPWTSGLKAAIPIVGPGIVADEQEAYQAGAEAHNRAAQHNVQVFSSYAAQTSTNSEVPRNYEVLQPSNAAISISSTGPSSVSGDLTAGADFTRGTGGAATVSPGGTMSGSVSGSVPSAGAATPAVGSGGGPAHSASPTGTAATTTPYPVGTSGAERARQDKTKQPFAPLPGTGRQGGNRTGGDSGGTRGGGVGERAGSRLYGPGGRGAAEAAGGRVSGEVARGGARGTGAALPGPAGATAEAAAARNAASARGAGMAPMGAGAGRGKGGEDEEHQRPAFLQENDPDETFIGDLGKTAPPVIGE